MPKKDENLDPVVVAALVDDGKGDKEDEEAKKKALEEAEEIEKSEAEDEGTGEPDGDADEDKEPEPKKDSETDKTDRKKPEEPKSDDKPKEDDDSGEEDLTDAEKADQEKQTRRERREERRKAFMESLKPKTSFSPRADLLKPDPSYKPLDYDAQDEFKADILKQDREKATQNAFAQGAEVERRIQEQERFWDRVKTDEEILKYNPDLQFMNPDNKEAYKPERAGEINSLYLNFIGYQEQPLFDPTTRQPLLDPATGEQQKRATVQRTDVPYRKFVEGYVASMEDWADEESADRSEKIVQQQSTQGIRPGGSSKRNNKPVLRPGVFKEMSEEEFEKYDEETDEELLAPF